MRGVYTVIAFFAVLWLIAPPPDAEATPWPDESYFVMEAHRQGLSNIYGDQKMLSDGYWACASLQAGWSGVAVMDQIMLNSGVDVQVAAMFVAVSQWALCPQTLPPQYRDDAIARGTLTYAR